MPRNGKPIKELSILELKERRKNWRLNILENRKEYLSQPWDCHYCWAS